MTQRNLPFDTGSRLTDRRDNPYLERVIRPLAIGVSIVAIVFTVFGVLGSIAGERDELTSIHNSSLSRIELAFQDELDSYVNDLFIISNDENLINHIRDNRNVANASTRAAEIISFNRGIYEGAQFIRIDEMPIVDFELAATRPNEILNVGTNPIYSPNEASAAAFERALAGENRAPVFGDFYVLLSDDGEIDPSLRIMIDGFVPIVLNDATEMVVRLQIDATELRNIINFAVGELVGEQENRRVLLLEGTENVIADSGAIGTDYITNFGAGASNIVGDAFYENLLTIDGLLLGTSEPIENIAAGSIHSSEIFDYDLQNLNWRIIIFDNALTYYTTLIQTLLIIGTVASILPIVIVVFAKRALAPVMQSIYEADTIVQTAANQANVVIESSGNQGELVAAARRVTTRLERLNEDLNAQRQKRARDMQVAGRIGRETATLTDLETLATRSINLICNELGFYHAQIFLLDEAEIVAILRYSRGEAGAALIEQGHQLDVGSDTVIGIVTAEKQAVIVNDTQGSEDPHAFNPLLAETRAEMGLPLMIGDTVLGALDIQSRESNVFYEEDIPIYQLLADQLAVGIYNAQLRQQTNQRIEQIDSLNRQLTRETWRELEHNLDLQSDYGAKIDSPKLAADISIRGEVIGSLAADLPEGKEFSEDEQQILASVAERVALAIENARLFQETQVSLSETQTLYELSRLLNEADDLEDVLTAILETVVKHASGGQVWLFDDSLVNQSEWASISVDLPLAEREGNFSLLGRRFQLSQYDLMQRLSATDVAIVEDLDAIRAIREELRELFENILAKALVFIPLNMRGAWKGFLCITFAEAQQFSQQERRIFTALIAQAGVAIDNRLLLQETEDALVRQERLYAASRLINTSQSLSDLVWAAVKTTSDLRLNFWLSLLEGERDNEGWAGISRIVAKSEGREVFEANELHEIVVSEFSPMREREPEILVEPGLEITDVPQSVRWMRERGYQFMAIFPLFSDNKPLALFYIVNEQLYELSQEDYEVYRALTGQMSTQIENRRLLSQTEATLREIQRLYVATREITGAESILDIYDAVAQHLTSPLQTYLAEADSHVSMTVLLARPQPTVYAPQLRYDYLWHNRANADETMLGRIISQEDAPFGSMIVDNNNELICYRQIDEMPDDFPMIREILTRNGATSAIIAPLWSRQQWFGVMILHSNRSQVMDENYINFMQSLADQVAIAVDNQTLLRETQFEQQRLDEILATLPVGVLVLDPDTLKPMSTNSELTQLLGKIVDFDEPFSSAAYDMYRAGTQIIYPDNELPIYQALTSDEPVPPADDLVIIREDMQRDLLMSAAPIFDADGQPQAIVTAFQDITVLRSIEQTVQENLRETVMLYETQRSLSEAQDVNELLDAITTQLIIQEPTDAYILVAEDNDDISLARSLFTPLGNPYTLKPILQNTVINIVDVKRDPTISDDTRLELTSIGASSVLVLPLSTRTRRQPFAWLVIVEEDTHAFSDDRERVLVSVAEMASQAMDNSYLVASTQDALQETAALYNANTAISRSRDRADLFHSIEALLQAMQPDMYAAYLVENNQLEKIFNMGFEANDELGFDIDYVMQMPLPQENGMFVSDATRHTLSEIELAIIKRGNIKAFAAINLRIQGEPSGRILLGYHEAHNFDTSDQRYLNTIADSASVVLDNQTLLVQVQSTLQETRVLYEASKALIETDEPQEIVNVIATHLIDPHINQVFIAMLKTPMWDSPHASVDVVASWQANSDVDLLGINLTAAQFPAWTQLASSSVLTIDDITDERYELEPMEQLSIESLDAQSLVILPLRTGGRAIGAIWLSSQTPYAYTDRERRIFQAFAEQTSLSLEARRLLEQTEQRATQLETSSVISQSVSQILDLDVLLPLVVELIKDQFLYDHVQVFLMDEENKWARLRASTGQAGQQLLEINHGLERGSDSVIGQVTATGEPSIALDTADANVVHKPNSYLPLTRSEMALPLMVKGEIVGALDVQSNNPNAFTEEDIQVLTTLASQIAVAIDNARLYEDTERSAADMSFLFDVTRVAAGADSLEQSLTYVALEVRDNLRAEVVAVYLSQDYEDYHGNRKQMIEIAALASDETIHNQQLSSYDIEDTDNLVSSVARNLEAEIVSNIGKESQYVAIDSQSQSALIMPISSGTMLIGVILVESLRADAYDNEALSLLQALTGSLAAVIQNTLLVERLQESNEQLREVDRLKSQFLASMSHELRTPLNSIIGFSRVMLKGIDGPLTEMQEQDLTTIYNSGNHLLRLINDILDQAKIEADELNLKFDYFEIKPLVESVKSIAIGLLKEKPSLDLHIELADGLPKAFGDEFRSRQILLNLMTNAIKFTNDGSVTLKVYAVENDPAPMLRLDVIDSGIGIEEEDLPTVFEQFRQVDNSLTRTVGGTGLGLPISKSLAELQGGQLTVASEVGVGSVFSVTIPTVEGADQALERRLEEKQSDHKPVNTMPVDKDSSGLISRKDIEEAKRRAGMTTNGSNGHQTEEPKEPSGISNITQSIPLMTQKRDVILVEDNKEMVDRFRKILQKEGFEVTTADFAAFAEAMIGQMRPSLVILDVHFAEGQGWQILQNLKERDDTFDIPVVVTTDDEDSERAYRLGAHTFIARPFSSEDLMTAVLEAEQESQRERIVIIDDQEDTIRLLTHVLEEHSDFKIYSAQSGDEGISLIARRRPNLIILDLRMPKKDGFAVLDELRGNPETAKIPILVVTGDIDLNTSEQEQLVDIHVLRKTDISQEEYDLFVDNVRSFLETNNRK